MAFSLLDFLGRLGEHPATAEGLHGLRAVPDGMLRVAAEMARRDDDAYCAGLEDAKDRLAAVLEDNEQAAELLDELYGLALALGIMSYRRGFLDGYLLTIAEGED